MGVIRRAAVAGQFYQNDSDTLRSTIERYLGDASSDQTTAPKALVAPHAGFVYSGPIAASAYATLLGVRDKISRVVLLGPCHRVAVQGLALSSANAFETPLGEVEIDQAACAEITSMPQVQIFDATHEREHSLEVHLPFLQVLLNNFKVIPIVVGVATPEQVGEVINRLWGGDETLIVVSSDLSHYLDYETARELDQKTSEAIELLTPAAIEQNGACGRFPLGGLLYVAKQRGMNVKTLDVRNSGDTAGQKDRVVGYGSWAFFEDTKPERPSPPTIRPRRTSKITLKPVPAPGKPGPQQPNTPTAQKKRAAASIKLQPVRRPKEPTLPEPGSGEKVEVKKAAHSIQASKPKALNEEDFEQTTRQLLVNHGTDLLLLSALSIDHGLSNQKAYPVKLDDHPKALQAVGACFVTLMKNGNLRGCIGSPQAYRPLVEDVSENAFRAAFEDPRFPKLEAKEREEMEISVSVLSAQTPIDFSSEEELLAQLRAGTDGLVIADGAMRALFLPSVWNQLPRRQDFLRRLKVKAGMPPNYWSTRVQAWRFIAAETSG